MGGSFASRLAKPLIEWETGATSVTEITPASDFASLTASAVNRLFGKWRQGISDLWLRNRCDKGSGSGYPALTERSTGLARIEISSSRIGAKPNVTARQASIDHPVSLSHLPATLQQRRVVLVVAVLLAVGLGIVAPFGDTQLPPYPAAVVANQAVVFINDFITSLLLFAQYAIVRSRGHLVLAGGYLFTSLIVIPHAMTFPNAFSDTGLLGAGLQSTAWLYFFWHLGMGLGILAYACIKDTGRASSVRAKSASPAIACCAAVSISLVVGCSWLATAGERFLPVVMADRVRAIPITLNAMAALMLLGAAIPLAVLWSRRSSVLDYWLMLVAWALVLEEVLIGFLTNARYSVGFYAGRGFSLLTSIIVLTLLLQETIRLYARLANANIMLERERQNKLLSLEAVAASISHEVKQPVGTITTNGEAALQLLESASPDLDEARLALNEIVDDGYRVGRILDNIRSLFGGVDQELEPIDANEAMLAALRPLRGELAAHGIRARVELAPELPLVLCQRVQLEEVVTNLLQNAVEAMDGVGEDQRVLTIRTQLRGHKAIAVDVEDTGPGIDPKLLENIFEPFVTTKSQGTGLGLAICRMIIERHGGQLSAMSDGNNGARFCIILPTASADNATESA